MRMVRLSRRASCPGRLQLRSRIGTVNHAPHGSRYLPIPVRPHDDSTQLLRWQSEVLRPVPTFGHDRLRQPDRQGLQEDGHHEGPRGWPAATTQVAINWANGTGRAYVVASVDTDDTDDTGSSVSSSVLLYRPGEVRGARIILTLTDPQATVVGNLDPCS